VVSFGYNGGVGASVHASACMMGKGGSGGSVLCIPLYVQVAALISELACTGKTVIYMGVQMHNLSGIMQGGIGAMRFFFPFHLCA
jgi:hypothetical protein